MSVGELLALVAVIGSLVPAGLFGYWSGLQVEQKLAAGAEADEPPEWLQQAREDVGSGDSERRDP